MDFAELREQKSAPWLRHFFGRYPRCLVSYCLSQLREYRGCTLGFRKTIADVRVQKFACGLRKQSYYYILPWFFPQWIRGPSFWDLGQKKDDLLARGTPNPPQPQIRRITIFYFIFYQKYSTTRNISEPIELAIVCSDWYFHE
jgi:hypothetical protein